MRTFPVFILLVLGCSHAAFGWSTAGHKIIGSIAFRQLSRSEQIRVVAILKQHPRFTEDFSDAMPEEIASGTEEMQDEWLFHQAAIWPDIVRPPGPSEQTAFHRSTWHYINVPHFLDGPSRIELSGSVERNLALVPPDDATLDTAELNVIQVIRLARQTCADDTTDAADRAVLMAWLFHNVGDIHQPLHSTALFSRNLFASGDNGGNRVETVQDKNLHSLWDHFPGGSIQYRTARNRALTQLADPLMAASGREAAENLNEKEWLDESHFLAVAVAYDAEVIVALRMMEGSSDGIQRIRLSDDYLSTGGAIAQQRLVHAGFRLGEVLKEIVAELPIPRSTPAHWRSP